MQFHGERARADWDAALLQHVHGLPGHSGSRVNHPHRRAGQPFDYRLQERIVRAPQDDGICPRVQQRLQRSPHGSLRFRPIQLPGLHQLYKALSHVLYNAHVILIQTSCSQILGAL